MYLKVSFDGRQKRGQRFKEDSEDRSNPQRGILTGNYCSSTECLASACSKDSILKCCICDKRYHAACVYRPLSDEVAVAINQNPYLWWTCYSCLTQLPISVVSESSSMDRESKNQMGLGKTEVEQIVKENLSQFQQTISSQIAEILSKLSTHTTYSEEHISSNLNQSCRSTKRARDDDSYQLNDVFDVISKQRKVSHNEVSGTDSTYAQAVSQQCSIVTIPEIAPKKTPLSRRKSSMNPSSRFTPVKSINDTFPTDGTYQMNKQTLNFKPIAATARINTQEEWNNVRRELSKQLTSTRLSFSKYNPTNGHVRLGFPSADDMSKAKESLLNSLSDTDLWCYELYEPTLLLPKLTIFNVPLDFEKDETNSSAIEVRDAAKLQIRETIIQKNAGVKSLVEKGSKLEVVFLQKHKNSSTIAIKVSPDIRSHIIKNCSSKLYLFSSRCRVADRFYYKQCYHCQNFGHESKSCPHKENSPVCLYCSDEHRSSTCPHKHNINLHKCSNCLRSQSPEIQRHATSHNASNPECPMALAVIRRIQNRTQMSVSKNS